MISLIRALHAARNTSFNSESSNRIKLGADNLREPATRCTFMPRRLHSAGDQNVLDGQFNGNGQLQTGIYFRMGFPYRYEKVTTHISASGEKSLSY
jgi:hypothetical protein